MSNLRALCLVNVAFAIVLTSSFAQQAWAQEEVSYVAEVVDVIDAFDEGDPFDFTFRARYGFRLERVKLTQQCAEGDQDGCVPGREGVVAFEDVGRYTHERHMLTLDAVFGLYRDLQIYVSTPLILVDRREIRQLQESASLPSDNPREFLLLSSFNGADRSGVDQIHVGLSWLPFSQQRESTLPTWLINVEGRFAVGSKLQPGCRSADGAVSGVSGAGSDGLFYTADDPRQDVDCPTDGGISERTNDLFLRMTLSRRYGILEPYIGFSALLHFVEEGDERYGRASEFPIYAETHFGLEFVPWERPDNQQFFRIGLHFLGGWNREAPNYGPLFDVLGTNPNMNYRFDPHNPDAQHNNFGAFSGLTRIEGHGIFGGRLTLTIQPARYVKFALDIGISHVQEHFITFTDQCRSPRGDEVADPGDPTDNWACYIPDNPSTPGNEESGNPNTILNDEWRPQIDNHGRRFRAEETTVFDAAFTFFLQF